MLPEMTFHHVGVAVNDIDATAIVYERAGYKRSPVVFDPVQDVTVCWLTKDGSPTVELLAPVDENSPINRILEKNGVTPYHCCYMVDDMEDTILTLKKQKYILVSKPVEAAAFNGARVCFLYHKNVGLIELVESPAKIVE